MIAVCCCTLVHGEGLCQDGREGRARTLRRIAGAPARAIRRRRRHLLHLGHRDLRGAAAGCCRCRSPRRWPTPPAPRPPTSSTARGPSAGAGAPGRRPAASSTITAAAMATNAVLAADDRRGLGDARGGGRGRVAGLHRPADVPRLPAVGLSQRGRAACGWRPRAVTGTRRRGERGVAVPVGDRHRRGRADRRRGASRVRRRRLRRRRHRQRHARPLLRRRGVDGAGSARPLERDRSRLRHHDVDIRDREAIDAALRALRPATSRWSSTPPRSRRTTGRRGSA